MKYVSQPALTICLTQLQVKKKWLTVPRSFVLCCLLQIVSHFSGVWATNTSVMQYWKTYYAVRNKKAFIWLSFRRFFKLIVKKLRSCCINGSKCLNCKDWFLHVMPITHWYSVDKTMQCVTVAHLYFHSNSPVKQY
jgi:hypothetical protein